MRVGRRMRPQDDVGMTLVELMAALLIFAIVSTGIIYTMLSVLQVTRDTRARQVAANLAAEEIDLTRDTADLFALVDADRDVTINGDTFHVHRDTQWVSDPGLDFTCGGTSGGTGAPLRYKRVNITVTWDNMRPGTEPVRSDTVIDPDERINDPAKGTILVSVLDATGLGVSGVTVSASPSPGSAVQPTDAQGCTYILKVAPATYTVTASSAGYRSGDQATSASQTVSVVAGQSVSVGFLYARAGTFTANLAAGYTPPPGVTLRIPTDLQTTFWNTYGLYPQTPSAGGGTRTQTFPLHPYPSGYQAFAGICDLADPGQWPEEAAPGGTLRGVRVEPAAALPGGTATIDVPMGIVTIAGGGSGQYLRAVSTDAGCTATYKFGAVLSAAPTTIALPYGTWQLQRASSATGTWANVPASALSVPTPAVPTATAIAPTGTVTFDPRVVTTP